MTCLSVRAMDRPPLAESTLAGRLGPLPRGQRSDTPKPQAWMGPDPEKRGESELWRGNQDNVW